VSERAGTEDPPEAEEVGEPASASPARPAIVERLLARRDRHKKRTMAFRVAWSASAFLIIVAGIVIAPLPGPGPVILIPTGLAMLALEFVWAERLLERALIYGDQARRGASDLSPGLKIAAVTVAILGIVAFIVALYIWAIPILPDS
jgi:hypothetical protein